MTRTAVTQKRIRRTATTNAEKRSIREDIIAKQIKTAGHKVRYEIGRIPYYKRLSFYKPDFILDNGIVIEVKGWFQGFERTKHLQLKEQYPDLDLRFVFERSTNTLTTKSKTTYAQWCEKNGFLYADLEIPGEWLNEPVDKKKVAAVKEILILARNEKH